MGITNFRASLENRVRQLRADLQDAQEEVAAIQTGLARLGDLHENVSILKSLVSLIETVLAHDFPGCDAKAVQPIRRNTRNAIFKSGEIGHNALTILRESGEWLRPRTVATDMLKAADAGYH